MKTSRLRTALLTSLVFAAGGFLAYSIPMYFQVLGRQPFRDASHGTSPPWMAFVGGAFLALATFVAIFFAFVLFWIFSGHHSPAKDIQDDITPST
jgi:hypothetical protein